MFDKLYTMGSAGARKSSTYHYFNYSYNVFCHVICQKQLFCNTTTSLTKMSVLWTAGERKSPAYPHFNYSYNFVIMWSARFKGSPAYHNSLFTTPKRFSISYVMWYIYSYSYHFYIIWTAGDRESLGYNYSNYSFNVIWSDTYENSLAYHNSYSYKVHPFYAIMSCDLLETENLQHISTPTDHTIC